MLPKCFLSKLVVMNLNCPFSFAVEVEVMLWGFSAFSFQMHKRAGNPSCQLTWSSIDRCGAILLSEGMENEKPPLGSIGKTRFQHLIPQDPFEVGLKNSLYSWFQ